jgi:hypothetical protein
MAIALAFFSARTQAQSEPLRVELGLHFSSITKPDFDGGKTEVGFGGRFTFNLNRKLALEAEGNFFPHNCRSCANENVGNLAQGFFGIKAGKRFRKVGIFGKARPGFVSFSGGEFDLALLPTPPGTLPVLITNRSRATRIALDVGGVVELYHSRRFFTRFDAGDTIIRYSRHTFNGFSLDPITLVATPFPIMTPAKTRHNFQFSAGVGIRF